MAFFNRDSSNHEGFALVTALLLAMIYLSLILIVLSESILAERSAARFRARTAAGIYAENGLELGWASEQTQELDGGSATGSIEWQPGGGFTLEGTGSWEAAPSLRRKVVVKGRIVGERVVLMERTGTLE